MASVAGVGQRLHADGAAPIVHTRGGAVSGVEVDRSYRYLRIPFAAPPVGALRFRPPVRERAWQGVRDGTILGAVCPQPLDPLDGPMGTLDPPADEAACLTVNVWMPTFPPAAQAGHPIFVWMHGGSWRNGFGGEPTYDGAAFARDGVVAVSFNYRLHALGLLDLRALFPDAHDTANLALRDAIAALEWTRDNAAAFGADADNVTICGESAGAAGVGALLAAPAAQGLFHRAILQSGSCHQVLEPAEAQHIAERFLTEVGVTPGDWPALQTVSVQRVVAAASDARRLVSGSDGRPLRLPWNTVRDDDSLPRTGYEALTAGALRDVDLLCGTTADEFRLRWLIEEPNVEPAPLAHLSAVQQRRLVDAYRRAGRGATRRDLHEAVTNDQSFLLPAVRAADAHTHHGGRTFMYLFSWPSPVLGGRIGAAHALENGFVFDTLVTPGFHGEDPPRELARDMHGAWVRFTATGDPNGGSLPKWPTHDAASRPVLRFDVPCELLHAPFQTELEAWADVADAALGVF
ncbi:MAG: carboxylesterase family protein [Solirubrobacteraceae bacterium]